MRKSALFLFFYLSCSTQNKKIQNLDQLASNVWIDEMTYQVYIDEINRDSTIPIALLFKENCKKANLDLFRHLREKVDPQSLKSFSASVQTTIYLPEGGCRLVVRYRSKKIKKYFQ